MNSKTTWVWLTIAAVLFAAVFAVEKYGRPKPPEIVALLPGFDAAAVTSVQFLELRAERTNGTWRLVKPIQYPAQAASIEGLLRALEQLAPAHTISGAELRQRKNADEEFGFASRTTLTLLTGEQSRQLLIGSRTAPGDQIYVQVVGAEGVFVVDAQLLKLLPAETEDWRDTGLVDLRKLAFDRISVSNATTALQLHRETSNSLWRLTHPIPTRADNVRLADSLQKLQATRVTSFVTDDPKSDAESFGLHAPELELTLAQDTNVLVTLHFGKSPTNDSTLIYARRVGSPAIVTVERAALATWLVPLERFRDPHLVTLQRPVEEVEVRATESYVLQRSPTNAWQLVNSDLPVDPGLVGAWLLTLVTAPIVDYKDSITAADLPKYGLSEPARYVRLATRTPNGNTNLTLAEFAFSEPKEGVAYVRRADENPVYAISSADYERLAVNSWQLRDRTLWRFSETNVVRLVVQRDGRVKDVRRIGADTWTAPGSPGVINGAAVEEVVHRLGELDAATWLGRGETPRAALGFTTNNLTLSIELKDSTKYEVEFGGAAADQYPYAAVKLDGETWYFEFPLVVFELLKFALLNDAAAP